MITTTHRQLKDVVVQRKQFGEDALGQHCLVNVGSMKLNVINDYNNGMIAVDVADQLRVNFSCRIKLFKRWHLLLWWLVDTA